jgi:hypothetical protein
MGRYRATRIFDSRRNAQSEGNQMSEPIYFSTNSHPISNPSTQIMRVDLDGGFTVNESIPATDAAKMVLGLMKQEWLADAQATKIREQEDHIKRLEEAGDEMEKYCRDYYSSNRWYKAKEDKP